MNQDIEKRILEKMDCAVDIADDGVIGLKKFAESPADYYDAILMDIRMPNMDGWTCAKQIRALDRPDAQSVLIMAVSANAFEEDICRSREAGMNEHMSKPVDVRILCETILRYVRPEKL